MTETLPRLFREALIEADATDLAVGTVRLSFASELPVLRHDKAGTYYEIISHSPGDMNIGILNTQGEVYQDHDEQKVIGSVIPGTVKVEADKKTRATVKITDPAWAERIANGERPPVSVGYVHLGVVGREPSKFGVPVLRFAISPYEISLLTTTPADPGVGLYRKKNMNLEEILQAALSGSRQNDSGLTREEMREYSILKAIAGTGTREPLTGLERAASDTTKYICGCPIGGTFVPWEGIAPRRRDLTVNNFANGGALVQSDMHDFIDPPFNKTVVAGLGTPVFTGLSGNYVAGRVTATATAQSLSETEAANDSSIVFDQPGFVPCRFTGTIPISAQVSTQTNGAVEEIAKAEIRRAIAVLADEKFLFGQGGSSEPLGIFNTPGIGSVLFGGAATWANIVAFESALGNTNCDTGTLAWAISPNTRSKWKQASRIAATNFPSFLMENNQVNQYPALASNQLSGQNQCLFGSWSEGAAILVFGNGFDLIVDRATQAKNGKIILTIHFWANLLIRKPACFCASADSAAQ